MRTSRAELIEKRVYNNILDSEVLEFNRLMDTEPSFVKEYQMVQHLVSYITNEKLIGFRDKLNATYHDYSVSRESRTKVFNLSRMWYYAASVAAVAVIFIGSFLLMNQSQTTDQLYDQYYNLDDVYLNTRSGNSTTTDILEQGLLLFEKDEYKESIQYFEQLPVSVTALYYSGVAHMELNEYDVAIFKFDQVIDDYLNVFYDQATWYKGLCLMKQNKTREAQNIFLNISKTDSYYSQHAKELSKELK